MMNFNTYRRILFKPGEKTTFILPWAKILVANCDAKGLVSYKNMAKYLKKRNPLFAVLSLLVFKENQEYFPVMQCNICASMQGLESLSMNQSQQNLNQQKCLHSLIGDSILEAHPEDWKAIWPVPYDDIEDNDEAFSVACNQDIEHVTLIDEKRLVAAVFNKTKQKVSILATLTNRSRVPICFTCASRPCPCYKLYKSKVAEENEGNNAYIPYADRRRNRGRVSQHYEEFMPFPYLGFNRTSFLYPLHRNEEFHQNFIQHLNGELQMPEAFLPTYDPQLSCAHGSQFDPDDNKLVKKYDEVVLFYESSETKRPIKMFGRPTIDECKCLVLPDTHKYCFQNLGGGMLMSYSYCLSLFNSFCNGVPSNSSYLTRSDNFSAIGTKTLLTQQMLNKGVRGFCTNLQFHKEDWTCDDCGGDTPDYIVFDGKCVGPTVSATNHLQEFDKNPLDTSPLRQGSHYKDRVFLTQKKERTLLR